MPDKNEIWKPLFENYEISDLGRLRKLKPLVKLIKPYFNKQGYIYYEIKSGKFLAHRLVALAFLTNPDNKPHVHHKNDIRHDSRAENLEWATIEENLGYINRDLTKADIDNIKTLLKTRKKQDAAKNLGISSKTLYTYCKKYGIKEKRETKKPKIPVYWNDIRRDRLNEIKTLIKEGKETSEIARQLGLTARTVLNYSRLDIN